MIHWAYLFKYNVCIQLILLILSSTCALYLCIMTSTCYCKSMVKKMKCFMASDKKTRWKKCIPKVPLWPHFIKCILEQCVCVLLYHVHVHMFIVPMICNPGSDKDIVYQYNALLYMCETNIIYVTPLSQDPFLKWYLPDGFISILSLDDILNIFIHD